MTDCGIPAWVNDYVSPPIPWLDKGRDRAGCDCWGYVRLIYAEQLGIDLPSFSERYVTALDRNAVADSMDEEIEAHWRPVEGEPRKVFDVVLLDTPEGKHVGVYLGNERGDEWFTHSMEGIGSCRSRLGDAIWRGRLEAVYRWKR
jgi:cell wall-associated NlpC family hydrolase